MTKSATLTKFLFLFLIANLLLVAAVSILRPAWAAQEPEIKPEPPEVQVPDDLPTVPLGNSGAVTIPASLNSLPTSPSVQSSSSPNAPALGPEFSPV